MRRFIILTLLVTILVLFLLFTDSGLQCIQYVADHNRDASWAPLVYYDIAKLHAIAGRLERSVETFDLIMDIYGNEKSDHYVENEYGEHYLPYALFYRAEVTERIAKRIMDDAYEARQEGDNSTYLGLRDEALGLYMDAFLLYTDFVNTFGPSQELYSTHELYSDANARQARLRETMEQIRSGN